MTRDEAARAFAEKMGWKYDGEAWDERKQFRIGAPNKYGEHRQRFPLPAPDAPLHEKLEFTGRIAEAVFPNEDEVFRCGWVHGVLENCIEDARVKYDLCFAALLAALAALEAR